MKVFSRLTLVVVLIAQIETALAQNLQQTVRTNATTRTLVVGRVKDVFLDDVDTRFLFMSVQTATGTIYASYRNPDINREFQRFKRFIGCDVRLNCEAVLPYGNSIRILLGDDHSLHSADDVTILSEPSKGPFDVPSLFEAPPKINAIDSCGARKAQGVVIARWHGDKFLLRTTDRNALKVQLRDRCLPAIGACVEVAGTIVTDLYRFNFAQAQWRTCEPLPDIREREPKDLHMRQLFTLAGHPIINHVYHGEVIRLNGTIKAFLVDETGRNRLLIDNESHKLIVDCSAIPEAVARLSEGCEIQVTGVGVLESDNWHSGSIFPKVAGLFLVPRTADDIVVLRQPSWWTPVRCAAVVAGLIVILVLILIWNAALRALVAHKSRALLREQSEKLSKALKIDERTRLAAELHDFHCQNLTAISYRVFSARDVCTDDPTTAKNILTSVLRMLKSCRTDLRRCLWDLRNDALNASDFAEAIRLTVTPVIDNARLLIRFSGRRSHISDTTAHALLCILRELCANAVNHGHATNLRIAGEVRQQFVRFSVQDDGCGFDPTHRPRQEDGHFGLDGIQERLNRLNGTLEIKSSPGQGTYVRLTVNHNLPSPLQ